jgi:hypothetical protein
MRGVGWGSGRQRLAESLGLVLFFSQVSKGKAGQVTMALFVWDWNFCNSRG